MILPGEDKRFDASGARGKVPWSGRIVSVQPRIRLLRSFDERQRSYQGYVLGIEGNGEVREVLIAVGEGAQEKHRFQAGMELSGNDHRPVEPVPEAVPV